jgi:hypothetical protein
MWVAVKVRVRVGDRVRVRLGARVMFSIRVGGWGSGIRFGFGLDVYIFAST